MKPLAATVLATIVLLIGLSAASWKNVSAQRKTPEARPNTETAVFSGGCFWGLQSAYDKLPGVVSSRVGYTGGTTPSPTYSTVIFGSTGHAEAVEVTFDPTRTSYAELVRFHLEHGRPFKDEPDSSSAKKHYRKSIFVNGAKQRSVVENILTHHNQSTTDVTSTNVFIENAAAFWEAEAEHQNYLAKCAF